MTYDEKIREIERLVLVIRDGNPLAIEERTDAYVRAVTLVRECKDQLKSTYAHLSSVTREFLGEL